jgi:hypothetical protein
LCQVDTAVLQIGLAAHPAKALDLLIFPASVGSTL